MADLDKYTPEKLEQLKRDTANGAIRRILETWDSDAFDHVGLVRLLNAAAAQAHNFVDKLAKSAKAPPPPKDAS